MTEMLASLAILAATAAGFFIGRWHGHNARNDPSLERALREFLKRHGG